MGSVAPARGAVARELALVLLVGVLPMQLLGALTFPPTLEEPPSPFPLVTLPEGVQLPLRLLAYALFVLAPALAILRSGLPRAHFGLVLRPGDLAAGWGGFGANYAAGWAVWGAYWATGFPLGLESWRAFHVVHASGWVDMVSTWPWYCLVVVAEELMARCYLLTRIRDLTGSPLAAVLASSLLYASWHLFWGLAGAFHVFVGGLIFGGLFAARRGVGAAAVSHWVFDALTLLPR